MLRSIRIKRYLEKEDTLPPFPVPAEYRPLHKYLAERFADIVVLTFAQIEDLIGFRLPDSARVQPEWWAEGDADGARSPQARAWTLADRTATANLTARTVMFERAREIARCVQ